MKSIITKILTLTLVLSLALSLAACVTPDTNGSSAIVKIIDVKLTDEQYAFVVKKGNTALTQSMNAFMADIKANGTFDALVAKYFEVVG